MCDKHYALNAVNKMGLGIDEIVDSTINFSRKNYADYFPDKPYPEDVKLVGNTIKSKKMPEYIEKFLDRAVRLLLQGKGQEFLEFYYEYLEKIYNGNIPVKQIATKGKIKMYIDEYQNKYCKELTAAGRPKSRQAWMELAIEAGLNPDLGETLYYINTGRSKSQSDVKKVKHYYAKQNGLFGDEKFDYRVRLEKEWKQDPKGKTSVEKPSLDEYVRKYHPEITIEDEIILNCRLLTREEIESEEDVFCKEGEEYNVAKYVDMFNKRIKPLLVCFSKDIRDRILVINPDDRQYFTEEESRLVSGQPNKEGDQDTYEKLMAMEDKEIRFWLRHPEWKIPFLEECGMDWDEIVRDFNERMEREKQLGIDTVREKFNEVVDKMSKEEIDSFEDGEIPDELQKIVDLDPLTFNFVSKDYPDIIIGTIYDILDRDGDKYVQEVVGVVE